MRHGRPPLLQPAASRPQPAAPYLGVRQPARQVIPSDSAPVLHAFRRDVMHCRGHLRHCARPHLYCWHTECFPALRPRCR